MPFSLSLMSSVQEISARIGRVTGHGIAGNIRRHYPKWLLYPVVFLLVLANTINLGADIGAMGDARCRSIRCQRYVSSICDTRSMTALPAMTPLGRSASAVIMPACHASSSTHSGGLAAARSFDQMPGDSAGFFDA